MLRTILRGIVLRASAGAAVVALGVSGTALASSPGAAVRPQVTLHEGGLFLVHHAAVSVPGRDVAVSGVARPYVAGQRVELRAFLNGHRFLQESLRLKPADHGGFGAFHVTVQAPRAGQVSVVVTHTKDAGLLGFERRTGYAALSEAVGPGSTGRFVQLIQQRLSALHFYLPQSGVYDEQTQLAVDAYHRLLGQGVSMSLSPGVVGELLSGKGSFHVRYPGQGRHVEGDLADQLVALINGNKVYWIFPISSGKPSTPTVLGSWRIYRRVPGYLPDGMYYSDFFYSGYALHGYDPSPDYPASHGCMRLPIIDAIPAFNWLTLGDWVDTYGTPPGQ